MSSIGITGIYGRDCPKCGSWRFGINSTTIGESYELCEKCGYAEKGRAIDTFSQREEGASYTTLIAGDPIRHKKVGNEPFKWDNYLEDPEGEYHKHGKYQWHKVTVTHKRVEGEVYSFAELMKEMKKLAPPKETPKRSSKIAGYDGWFIQHTIKGQKYWYRHWYDRSTKKMRTAYVGKVLPTPIPQEPLVTEGANLREPMLWRNQDIQAFCEEHMQGEAEITCRATLKVNGHQISNAEPVMRRGVPQQKPNLYVFFEVYTTGTVMIVRPQDTIHAPSPFEEPAD